MTVPVSKENSAGIRPEAASEPVMPQRCRSCGKELSSSYLLAYPGAVLCSRRRCHYRELVRRDPETAALLAQLPRRYRRARLRDFAGQDIYSLRSTLVEEGSVFLSGTQGIGKTHLAAALVNSLLVRLASDKGYDVVWRRSTDLLLELQETFSGAGDTRAVAERFRRAGLLVLDDFGAEKLSEWSVASIYAILAERVDQLRPTIVTSNLNLDEIDAFEPRIASRLAEFATLVLPEVDLRLQNGRQVNNGS